MARSFTTLPRGAVTFPLVASALVSFLTGCASVSVKNDSWTQERLAPPKRVYVADYDVPSKVLDVDRTGAELDDFRQSVAKDFTAELCARISERIAPAVPLTEAPRPPVGSWVVEGRVLRVNQGSRLLRSLVGLGAGGTKLEVRTEVFAVGARGSRRKVAEIETTGGSNAEPGLLTLPTPIGGGVRAVLSATQSGVTADQRRTARMITAAMAERLEAQGHQLRGKREKVKRLQTPATTTQ